ncbi:hypothetical protein F0Q45_23015 [Mycobacterium simiae]|uniref:Uncharacterized protein n=1 Tax=Mycobacterium simiae TaxID=1784 RepID=A0A5B1BDU0_MYCSI|nr:hypothetical protein F0Q45_23015 [Mycobacterium simiae]
MNQPIDQCDAGFQPRDEAERQQDFGSAIGVLRESGWQADDRVGMRQLSHAVRRALVAREIAPTLLALASRDHDHAAVGHAIAADGQGSEVRAEGSASAAQIEEPVARMPAVAPTLVKLRRDVVGITANAFEKVRDFFYARKNGNRWRTGGLDGQLAG